MKPILLAIFVTTILSINSSTTTAAVIEQILVFELDSPEPATITEGAIAHPGRNVFSLGGLGVLPIETVTLSGHVAVRLRIDDTTGQVQSLRFVPELSAIDTDSPINFFLESDGYIHVGLSVDPISNPAPRTPEFVATGNPGAEIVPRSGFVNVGPDGVFDADRQSLAVTSGEYIGFGTLGSAFFVPSGSIRDASVERLLVTSQALDPNGDMGLISLRQTSSGYRGNIQLDLSDFFSNVIVSATIVPEPSSAVFLATLIGGGTIFRRRARRAPVSNRF